MSARTDPQIGGGQHNPDGIRQECVNKIEIIKTDTGTVSLKLSFEKLFLCRPGSQEMYIFFSTKALERYVACVWRQISSN